jgi:uncharacterized transporter YbjL
VIVCVICLAHTCVAAKIAGFEVGHAAGMWAGAQTISAYIGLAKADFARVASSVDVPVPAQTTIHRGDILKLSGTKTHISRTEKAIGYADRPSSMTDMVRVGLFIFVSGLLGALTLKVGGVPIILSVSGGVLIEGCALGIFCRPREKQRGEQWDEEDAKGSFYIIRSAAGSPGVFCESHCGAAGKCGRQNG